MSSETFAHLCHTYTAELTKYLDQLDWETLETLSDALKKLWSSERRLFLCGNGGSAANALHLATDFIYGIGKGICPGMKVHALTSNTAVITCLANDISYEKIFSSQLEALASSGDILIVLSGSGNSENIIQALQAARSLSITTWAIVGFSGGKAKELADHVIHFPVDDMQIAEDLQMIIGHILMKSLSKKTPISDAR